MFANSVRWLACAVALMLAGMHLPAALAQSYPAKPIKIILPFAAGGPTDAIARLLAQRLTEQLAVQVLVENRPGGSGVPGTEAGSKAPPDGYTLTLATTANFGVLPNLRKTLPYDPRHSFVSISQVSSGPFFVVVNSMVPASTLGELINLAKTRPGTLNAGSPGVGTAHHLALELFKLRAGVDVVHVPYTGSGKVIGDIIEGRIQLTFDQAVVLAPHARSGRLRILAVASSARSQAMPEVPTALEAGLPGFEVLGWNGVLAPVNTPQEIVRRLHREIVAAAASPAMREGFARFFVDSTTSNSPEEFAAFIDRELGRWGELTRAAKMVLTD